VIVADGTSENIKSAENGMLQTIYLEFNTAIDPGLLKSIQGFSGFKKSVIRNFF